MKDPSSTTGNSGGTRRHHEAVGTGSGHMSAAPMIDWRMDMIRRQTSEGEGPMQNGEVKRRRCQLLRLATRQGRGMAQTIIRGLRRNSSVRAARADHSPYPQIRCIRILLINQFGELRTVDDANLSARRLLMARIWGESTSRLQMTTILSQFATSPPCDS